VDHAHPALAQTSDDAVVAERRADEIVLRAGREAAWALSERARGGRHRLVVVAAGHRGRQSSTAKNAVIRRSIRAGSSTPAISRHECMLSIGLPTSAVGTPSSVEVMG